jgi:hypothetical protein
MKEPYWTVTQVLAFFMSVAEAQLQAETRATGDQQNLGSGAGIYMRAFSLLQITNSLVAHNSAFHVGGGIFMDSQVLMADVWSHFYGRFHLVRFDHIRTHSVTFGHIWSH